MRIFIVGAVLVAAFVAALAVGMGSGGDGGGGEAEAAPEVKPLTTPEGSMKAPKLADTGSIPNLQPKPEPVSTTDSGSAGSSGATGTGTTSGGSTGGGSTGGGSTGGGGGTPTVRPPG